MSRARATSLALVNWKGVFYERYALDRHVTALEGDNGAGKTTVMIGAYVVLLPDMTRLRFTNLGETGATGGDKGIWGRLGEAGRPSYAALDFVLPSGERVVAGVQLERKGEPTVEPTPFLVTGLADDVRLQDLLLLVSGDDEAVPELPELRENAARLGGRLQSFASARDYFAALFEHGITPMRLGTDEERNKLNEMLKTSMTGGMSKGLLSELRSFLLKEEGGLADTLQRMRANLDACRRTRTEVEESQRLEREIGAVYEAGESMFAAAIAATRARADEMSRRVQEATARRSIAEDAQQAAEAALARVRVRADEAQQVKQRADARFDSAQAEAVRVEEAVRLAAIVADLTEQHAHVATAHEGATASRSRSAAALVDAEQAVAQASLARERAAGGLADLQQGLSELHRRADAHRRATDDLATARAQLGRPELDVPESAIALAQGRARLHHADEQRRELVRRLVDADVHRREHADALSALTILLGAPAVGDPHEAARAALTVVGDWRTAASRRARLKTELAGADADALRQQQVRERALALGIAPAPGEGRRVAHAALDEVEANLQEQEERARGAELAANDADRALRDVRREIDGLEARAITWRALAGLALRVTEVVGVDVVDRASLDAARAALRERAAEATATLATLRTGRDALAHEARELLLSGGTFAPELLALRDHLAAELLAESFDHVPLDDAGELEAHLGPLADALVVPDVDAAIERVRGRAASLGTVWLVPEDAALSLDPDRIVGKAGERDVVVAGRDAVRVTRVPTRPTLGRSARERRAQELEAEAAALDAPIEQALTTLRALDAAAADGDALLEGLTTWLAGDPGAALDAARRLASEAETSGARARTELAAAKASASTLRPRRDALRALLPDVALLDPPDHRERADALRADLAAADRAAAELARVGDAPDRLARHLDALRHAPLSDAEVEAARAQATDLAALRDALDEGLRALERVAANPAALTWTDAADELRAGHQLVPALERQHRDAVAALERAQGVEKGARAERDAADEAWRSVDADLKTAVKGLADARDRLEDTGVDDPTPERLDAARADVEASRASRAAADADVGTLREAIGQRQGERDAAAATADAARSAEQTARSESRPGIEAWDKLRPLAEANGVLDAALTERFTASFGGKGSPNAWQDAGVEKARLLERLRHARGGDEVLTAVRGFVDGTDQSSGEGYLRAWLVVRDWLRRRLPAQIADVDEPLVALGRLRDHLGGLIERLDRQERDLRGASEDVARGIDVHIRKAQGQVARLNKHLNGVRFGSIRAIRVKLHRVERMEQVLRALREGAAQELLFQASLPVEEALAAVFERFGGGRSGGQKLLDYREYIHLQVEVLRHEGADWEIANPTRLSTGEAIGVGAALMMVVLTEWERDANLLRGRRAHGSMRFLFLDEANRLDNANLGTLFDLCRNLDLQLLVAAPEVARAEGCTVFRLVRTKSDDGREEVLVSGRRVVGEA